MVKLGKIKQNKSKKLSADSYWEYPVRISFSQCSVQRQHCISSLEKKTLIKLYKTLGKHEGRKWKDFDALRREKGLTRDKEGTDSYLMLKRMFKYPGSESDVTFGHIRVDGTHSPFRVFGARTPNTFYVLMLDPKGKVHH